jgi:hypothetical protein
MSSNEHKQPEGEELVSLNAENLDADKLDDQDLEEVAGGGTCGTFTCTGYYPSDSAAPVE